MRSQYILIAAIIIISITFSVFYSVFHVNKKIIDVSYYGRNLENEIYYISSKFSKEYIGDFLNKFSIYMKNLGYNFSFICISPINLSIQPCNGVSSNCCYYFNSSIPVNVSILKFCNKTFTLYNEGIVCICYNISSEDSYYSNLICT